MIEVGPGPGGLTRALLAAGARRVIAIEKDSRALGALHELQAVYPERLEIIAGDALDVPVHTLGVAPRKVVANLPYNVATPLLMQWLVHMDAFARLTLLFQKEVALRILAEPGGKTYGRLAVMTQVVAEGSYHFEIAPQAFVPPPKVTSALISLVPRPEPLLSSQEREVLAHICAKAFNQRRKMLKSSLKGVVSPEQLEAAGIAPAWRAEQVSVAEYCRLARACALPPPAA